MADTDVIDQVKLVSVENLIPYGNNPKEHPEEQVERIAESIREFGFTVPMIIDGDGSIIAGHGRYQAIQEHLDLEQVPVIQRDDLSEAQADALRVADNKITESTWDIEKLGDELNQLDYDEIDIDALGFEEDELDSFVELEKTEHDVDEIYEEADMPKYENEDEMPEYSIKVNFADEKSLNDFNELVGETVTTNTKSIWYPEQEEKSAIDKEWVDENEE